MSESEASFMKVPCLNNVLAAVCCEIVYVHWMNVSTNRVGKMELNKKELFREESLVNYVACVLMHLF